MEPDLDSTTRPDAWTDFWRATRQGAIDLHANDPVATALRVHWQAQIHWLSQCANLVDVGSGPAILPRLLLSLAPIALAHLRWTCVDRAHVTGGADVPVNVKLRDGEDFCVTEPGADLADALVSNFGIEYLAHEGAAAASARWLRRGGQFHAVIHAHGSIIDRVSTASIDDIAWALDEVSLFERARALFVAMAGAPVDPIERMMHGVDVRDAYNAAVNRVKQRMEDRGTVSPPLLNMLNGIRLLAGLAANGSLPQAEASLAAQRAGLQAEVCRLRTMQVSAHSEMSLNAFEQKLQAAGFEQLERAHLDCEFGAIAWVVTAKRS